MDDDWVRGYREELWRLLKRYGWVVQHVSPDGPGEYDYAYTVGLSSRGIPEMVIFGLPTRVAQTILNAAARRALGGDVPAPGTVIRGLVQGYGLAVLEVRDVRGLALVHDVVEAGGLPRACQLVFPDREGRWPWSAGSDVADTPLLGDPQASELGPWPVEGV